MIKYIPQVRSLLFMLLELLLNRIKGVFVAVQKSSIGNSYSKGTKIKDSAANPSEWTDDTLVFGIAAFHQIHCVVSWRRMLLKLQNIKPFGRVL